MGRGPFSLTDYLYRAAAQYSAGPFTVAAWIYPTSLGAFQTVWGLGQAINDTDRLRITLTNADAVRAQVRNGGTTVNADAPGTVSINTWQFVALTCTAATKIRAWLGASAGTESTIAITFPTVDQTAIGLNFDATPDQPLLGLMAVIATWGSVLSDAIITALAGGNDPRHYSPASFHEVTGTGGENDLIGAFHYTEAGVLPDAATPAIRRVTARGPWQFGFPLEVEA